MFLFEKRKYLVHIYDRYRYNISVFVSILILYDKVSFNRSTRIYLSELSFFDSCIFDGYISYSWARKSINRTINVNWMSLVIC